MSFVLYSSDARSVTVPVPGANLEAVLAVPNDANGLVVIAHGSGHGLCNPRNQQLAATLNDASLATLMCDLLTEEEELLSEITGEFRFDAAIMARRLTAVLKWCESRPELRSLPIGLLGKGTGAAAALIVAAELKGRIRAVAVKGGRPDLAWDDLPRVQAPTLLIRGELDTVLQVAYSQTMPRLTSATKELFVVPGAGQLFKEASARRMLGERVANWFNRHFGLVEASRS